MFNKLIKIKVRGILLNWNVVPRKQLHAMEKFFGKFFHKKKSFRDKFTLKSLQRLLKLK